MRQGVPHTKQPIRWGMVGGGATSNIGYSHRSAALRDRNFTLLAGAFDVDAERGRALGQQLGVAPDRCYANYREMFDAEAKRPDGVEAVTIATPNSSHFEISKAALEAGLHVVCEKPLCFTVAEAETLRDLARTQRKIVGVAYGYSGYQMIEQARAMVANGDLGEVRLVNLQFAHGGGALPVEASSVAAQWRVDPRVAGPSFVLGDLGTHPIYLARTILPHLTIKRLLCARQSFVKGRAPLEDNAVTLMEYDNCAFGTVWVSAVNAGASHSQKLRIVGSRASLEWWDEHPNQLIIEATGEPQRVLDRASPYLYPQAREDDRIGGGHPEGYFDAWANLYARFAMAMEASDENDAPRLANLRYADVEAGLDGVRWVAACVRSADAGGVWVDYV